MANTLAYYTYLYILASLFGMGLCVKEYLVALKYDRTVYMARGSLSGAPWMLDGNGQPNPSTEEVSVILNLCQSFEVLPKKEVSIGFDGKFSGEEFLMGEFDPTHSDVTIITNFLWDENAKPKPKPKTFKELKDFATNSQDRVSFPLLKISAQKFSDGVRIVSGISIGSSGTSSPDVKLVSNDDSKIELHGYKKDNDFRFVGKQAEAFVAAKESVKSWNLYEVNGIDLLQTLTLTDKVNRQTLDGQLIVDVDT